MVNKLFDHAINKGILLCLFLLCVSFSLSAQKVTITGTVSSPDGNSLPGVSVKEKDGKAGTSTNAQGKFSIYVDESARLIFSSIGFVEQEVSVRNVSGPLRLTLAQSSSDLNEVTVTALGIRRESKGLTYSSQKVGGGDLTKVPQTNFVNSLSGRVAGLTVNSSASGVGGSVKVTLRGNKSAQGSNQPLYVVDGIPLVNVANENANTMTNMDFGDGISNLNPDDIESITVLKGATSAALYGSQAANGVILITTKKGKAGDSKVSLTSSTTFDRAAFTPQLQTSYAQTATGSDLSWGAPMTGGQKDQISEFFKTGGTYTNGISFTSGSEKSQMYLSYMNTMATGIIPNNSLSRHNINFHGSSKYFNNKLTLDVNGNFILQSMNNPPTSGQQLNSLWGLYLFPRGLDFDQYKNAYEVFDPERKLMTQNWWRTPDAYIQNPFWVTNRMLNQNTTNRTMLKISAKWDITDWLNIQARGNADRSNNVTTSKMFVGTPAVIAGPNGSFGVTNVNSVQYYGDVILNFNKTFNKLKINALLGSSILDMSNQGEYNRSFALYIANVFNLQNMDPTSGNTSFGSVPANHSQLQAVFGSLNLSYNDWLYLDITGRNDWSSNLSFTPNGSYFYPSFGLSGVLNQVLNLPEAISFAKVRASYAIVGNTVPNYVTNPINHLTRGGGISFNTTAPFNDLNPEKSKSLELGAELRFLQDKLSLDFTYYKTNTINQFFSIAVPPGTGYSERFINGGNIQNSGVEISLGYAVRNTGRFRWNTTVNFSANKNVIKELAPNIDQFVLNGNDLNNFFSILKVGGSYGDMYSPVWDRDSLHRVKIDGSGKPIIKSGAPSYVGNSNPKFQLGWTNSFKYNDFTMDFLVDGSFGSKIMSVTQAWLNGYGVSKKSAEARDQGGVPVNGVDVTTNKPVSKVDAYNWYFSSPYGESVYDGSVVRLRELSIGYQLPKKIFNNGFVKSIRFSLIGRNLIYFYRPAPVDSQVSYSVGNGYSGLESFELPPTRSFGFNVNVGF